MIGNILVVLVLGICAGLAVGYLWKNRKKPHCGGDCTHCMGCQSIKCQSIECQSIKCSESKK